MRITELAHVVREIHVAPCLKCGCSTVQLSDSNYSSFNTGGGKCSRCGHEATGGVGCLPSKDELAAIWNAANDIPALIRVQEQKIKEAHEAIHVLLVTDVVRRARNCASGVIELSVVGREFDAALTAAAQGALVQIGNNVFRIANPVTQGEG